MLIIYTFVVMESIHMYKIDKVLKVIDGAQMIVDIDLGFDIMLQGVKIHLYGIKVPGIKDNSRARGIMIRDHVREFLNASKGIAIIWHKEESKRLGKHFVTMVVFDEFDHELSFNDYLLDTGMAEVVLSKSLKG